MKIYNLGSETQYSYWGNVDYASNKDALKARNAKAKELKSQGHTVNVWSLAGQLRKYSGLGQPDGRIGTVYYISVKNKT